MKKYENLSFDEERALYGERDILVKNCAFDGPADGESAFKEGEKIKSENCYFNLRYPFWHCEDVEIADSHMTENCRAALWYSSDVKIIDSKLHGIKALRECENVYFDGVSIISPEFGWFSKGISVHSSSAEGEYFMFKAENLDFNDIKFKGKYSFQYIKNAVFENCVLETKDAFWHAKDVLVKNCVVKGEYLAWYSENVTFENCVIYGTQPLCYCKNLKLINCEMHEADLAFELSEVNATLTAPILSIKNPLSGEIRLPYVNEIINDNAKCECKIILEK